MSATIHSTTGDRNGGDRPIFLVHGFASCPAMLAPLARYLSRALRRKVVRVSLCPGREDLRVSAATLHALVAEQANHVDFEHADIVAHSMGGLTATYVLKRLDRGRHIRTVVTLGTPHRGAPLAGLGALLLGAASRAIWQMVPGSELIDELQSLMTPRGCRVVSIAGTRDWLVPARCARIAPEAGHANLTLQDVCHTDLLMGRDVFAGVAHVLAQRPERAGRVPVLRPERGADRPSQAA